MKKLETILVIASMLMVVIILSLAAFIRQVYELPWKLIKFIKT